MSGNSISQRPHAGSCFEGVLASGILRSVTGNIRSISPSLPFSELIVLPTPSRIEKTIGAWFCKIDGITYETYSSFMNTSLVPISTLFIGLNGLIAFVLSYIAASERVKARVWHGESKEDVAIQPDPLNNPSPWVLTIERLTNDN